jgi:hypothetical protein
MLVLSNTYVLSPAVALTADNALIGWHQLVTTANVVADFSDPDFPVTNLANPATNLFWRAAAPNSPPDSPPYTLLHLTVTLNYAGDVDYVGIAGHNFGSAQIPMTIEGTTGATSGSPPEIVWFDLVQQTLLADDAAAIFRFTPQPLAQVRVKLAAGGAAIPFLAVLRVGKLLVMERGIYDNHTPITDGRRAKVVSGRSESGKFLGRVVIQESIETRARFTLLTPAWYRANMRPFILDSKSNPFFFAWRPATYPYETGYAWMINDPMPTNEPPAKLIGIELEMSGEA